MRMCCIVLKCGVSRFVVWCCVFVFVYGVVMHCIVFGGIASVAKYCVVLYCVELH